MTSQFKNIGTTIKMIREAKNIKQYALQGALKTSCNLSKLEANKTQISLQTFLELLDLLNVSTEEFFILHSMYNQKEIPPHETIYNYLSYHAPRVKLEYLQTAQSVLSIYGTHSLDTFATLKQKLLYHKLSCFYYLNFQHNRIKAKYHSDILFDYYKNNTHLSLLSELELLPMILPFISLQEGQILLDDFRFFQRLQADKNYLIQKRYLYAQLTFAKRCLEERQHLLFEKTLEVIVFFIKNLSQIDIYCEFLILKGILLYDFEHHLDTGRASILKGLKLAREFHLSNIYYPWKSYSLHVYNIK